MTKEERHSLIIDTLIKHESIMVSDLSSLLAVSAVTIRKDLTELEKENKLYRSHGKAILINPYINNRSVNEKEKLYRDEKKQIGKAAASLITKDDSIIIASGTTVLAFARSIRPTHRLTVISASLQVSEILGSNESIDVVQLGGSLRNSSLSAVGKYAEAPLADFSCSKLFLGVDGIDLDFGITTTDIREADLNKVMMRAAQKTIVLADSSKFRRRGFSKIANMDEIDLIITDSHISDKLAQRIESMGIELKIVSPDGHDNRALATAKADNRAVGDA
jgi:DeoR/GlpR family transcriptional regulator of sugar metabolism